MFGRILLCGLLSLSWQACSPGPCEAQNPSSTAEKPAKGKQSTPIRRTPTAKKQAANGKAASGHRLGSLNLTDTQWQQRLTSEQFRILRRKGTERAFSGALLRNKAKGFYQCAGCGARLFSSKTKFKSGTGWPSFFESLPGRVKRVSDSSHAVTRTEIVCSRCGGHLGHVFNDGPRPTGERHCVNSLALKFESHSTP